MNRIAGTTFAILGLMLGSPAARAELEAIPDFSPLARNVVAAVPGVEAIIPYVELRDPDDDQVIEQLAVRFDVYQGGTNTKLHATPLKTTAVPPAPCTSPQWQEQDMTPKFIGRPGNTRVTAVMRMTAECQEQGTGDYKEVYKTFVYSTDASKPNGVTWTWALGRELLAANGIDTDGDDVPETLMLSLAVPVSNGENVQVVMLRFSDGGEVANNTYPLDREK
jgi:hypothetical protein